MRKNMGSTDKILYVSGATLIAVLYFSNFIDGTAEIFLEMMALIYISSSFISFYPLYFSIGISARNKV
ncbi:Protein of unknown function [Flavobacterium micromati]|uniref:Inner membrane protein YgaP-like transmembrane domain-containing protein n=1 Tax=Flavobacterium micromati TaxID=229205 RepID=A0A1M5INP7_9FLAO|nr:DUF2892 domain-containing protein [Flavobacterium micromati]SHG29856.1 Protein of unknown function [Flavobacterium micromati]